MHLELRTDDGVLLLRARPAGEGWRVEADGRDLGVVAVPRGAGEVELVHDGRRRTAWVAARGAERLVFLDGRVHALRLADDDEDDGHPGDDPASPELTARMPGTVVKLLVGEGDAVDEGTPLLIMEAMKMETEIVSPLAGRVARIHAEAGRVLAAGEPLLDLDPEGGEA